MIHERESWQRVARKGLPRFRFFRSLLSIEKLDEELPGSRLQGEWEHLKEQMQPGDKVWPFSLNVRPYLGLRRGYVVLRGRQP